MYFRLVSFSLGYQRYPGTNRKTWHDRLFGNYSLLYLHLSLERLSLDNADCQFNMQIRNCTAKRIRLRKIIYKLLSFVTDEHFMQSGMLCTNPSVIICYGWRFYAVWLVMYKPLLFDTDEHFMQSGLLCTNRYYLILMNILCSLACYVQTVIIWYWWTFYAVWLVMYKPVIIWYWWTFYAACIDNLNI